MEEQNLEQSQNETPGSNGSADNPGNAGKTNLTISGKSFSVDPDLAQAYTEFTTGIDRRFDERSQELGALRQFKNDSLTRDAELQNASNNQEQSVDYGTLMYEDPGKFVGTIDNKIQEAKNELRQEYQNRENTKNEEQSFWNSMWSENADLAKRKGQVKDVVKLVGQKYASLNLPNTKESRDLLANETRTWIKNMIGNDIENPDGGFLEASSTQTVPVKTQEETKPRRSAAQITRDMQEKRRKAMEERK